MSSPRISYTPHPDATPEVELSALANVYAFILDSAKKRGRLPDKSGPADATLVKNAEEVSHVEQRPNRPSEIVITSSEE